MRKLTRHQLEEITSVAFDEVARRRKLGEPYDTLVRAASKLQEALRYQEDPYVAHSTDQAHARSASRQ